MPMPGRELIDAAIADGSVDTVVLAFPDMHGRPVGKRVTADFFTAHVAEHGIEACDYLLAVDVDMNPLPGLPLHQLGHRLRRLRLPARLRHGPPDPLARGHGLSSSAT